MKMERITNHATDRASARTGFRSEYDMDIDLIGKPSAYSTAFKRSYAGNVRANGSGYRNRTSVRATKWQLLKMNQEHHKAEMARRKAAEEAKIDRRPKKVKRAEWMAKKKAAKRGGR